MTTGTLIRSRFQLVPSSGWFFTSFGRCEPGTTRCPAQRDPQASLLVHVTATTALAPGYLVHQSSASDLALTSLPSLRVHMSWSPSASPPTSLEKHKSSLARQHPLTHYGIASPNLYPRHLSLPLQSASCCCGLPAQRKAETRQVQDVPVDLAQARVLVSDLATISTRETGSRLPCQFLCILVSRSGLRSAVTSRVSKWRCSRQTPLRDAS